MVAQTTWEDDIIWDDSEETKQKVSPYLSFDFQKFFLVLMSYICFQVMQNLNCKTNAAGWLPSSSNRTAQAFSQPGKGILPSLGGSVRLSSNQMNPPSKSNAKNL